MADPRVSQPSYSCWKQWQRKSSNACYSKRILLLLMWQTLLSFSYGMLFNIQTSTEVVLTSPMVFSYSFAPLIGWLADVRFGRYGVIRFGSSVTFFISILYYLAMIFEVDDSTLSTLLWSMAAVAFGLSSRCYSAAMLPFITDQIIGASSDELGAVVRWYFWAYMLGVGMSQTVVYFCKLSSSRNIFVGSTLIFAIPLAVIIISDSLCQQWLDRTHKVTNPIKLIIQVLNYTRKHRYPERRSAFTYIDEEQPTRMDYGKEKFGGPFSEEEVEDVKTVLRLLPLVICLSFCASVLQGSPVVYLINDEYRISVLNQGIVYWLFPLLLIPLYQLLLHRCFNRYSLSMLRYIGAGLFMGILGYILLTAIGVFGVIVSDDTRRYISCTSQAPNATYPGDYMEWYWKLGPCILYNIGKTMTAVLVYEFIISQSPDKTKGLIIGISLAFRVFILFFTFILLQFTLCYDLPVSLVLVVLFLVFLVLSKCYTLRERNREINIQAIVEEHYERYMDQEEEYMRENSQ